MNTLCLFPRFSVGPFFGTRRKPAQPSYPPAPKVNTHTHTCTQSLGVLEQNFEPCLWCFMRLSLSQVAYSTLQPTTYAPQQPPLQPSQSESTTRKPRDDAGAWYAHMHALFLSSSLMHFLSDKSSNDHTIKVASSSFRSTPRRALPAHL